MWFVVLGVVLAGLKLAGVSPVVAWPWWAVLVPFGLAAAWWWIADVTGLTKKAQARKMEQRVDERRRRQLETLGLRDDAKGGGAKAFEGAVTQAPSTHVPAALKPKEPGR